MRDKGFKNGILDEFYIYDRVLTSAEIKILAEQNKANQGIELDDQSLLFHLFSGSRSKVLNLQKKLYDQRLSFGKQRENWADHGNERNAEPQKLTYWIVTCTQNQRKKYSGRLLFPD